MLSVTEQKQQQKTPFNDQRKENRHRWWTTHSVWFMFCFFPFCYILLLDCFLFNCVLSMGQNKPIIIITIIIII